MNLDVTSRLAQPSSYIARRARALGFTINKVELSLGNSIGDSVHVTTTCACGRAELLWMPLRILPFDRYAAAKQSLRRFADAHFTEQHLLDDGFTTEQIRSQKWAR